MLRHLGLIAVCACIVASVGCDGGKLTTPTPPPPQVADSNTTVTVQFSGHAVNGETGAPVANVAISLYVLSSPPLPSGRPSPQGWDFPRNTATSEQDGTFSLSLNLPSDWKWVSLRLIAPSGYDDTHQRYDAATASDRPAIRMYPTLVIRPGESMKVRVDSSINVLCGWDGYPCRRILVAASPGESVELEIVPDDGRMPISLGLGNPDGNPFIFEPDDMSVRRLVVPPGGLPYIFTDRSGTSSATVTARR